MDIEEFKLCYGTRAIDGAKALNDEDMAKLGAFLRDNFTTGKALAILGAVETLKESVNE